MKTEQIIEPKINLNRMVVLPLAIMVTSTLILMSSIVFRQLRSSDNDLRQYVASRVNTDLNSFAAEIYLGQVLASNL